MLTHSNPSAFAWAGLLDSAAGRAPMITLQPLSLALAAWALPWMP